MAASHFSENPKTLNRHIFPKAETTPLCGRLFKVVSAWRKIKPGKSDYWRISAPSPFSALVAAARHFGNDEDDLRDLSLAP
jgi:hypothetical protein